MTMSAMTMMMINSGIPIPNILATSLFLRISPRLVQKNVRKIIEVLLPSVKLAYLES
jgi:hypothetical protein